MISTLPSLSLFCFFGFRTSGKTLKYSFSEFDVVCKTNKLRNVKGKREERKKKLFCSNVQIGSIRLEDDAYVRISGIFLFFLSRRSCCEKRDISSSRKKIFIRFIRENLSSSMINDKEEAKKYEIRRNNNAKFNKMKFVTFRLVARNEMFTIINIARFTSVREWGKKETFCRTYYYLFGFSPHLSLV